MKEGVAELERPLMPEGSAEIPLDWRGVWVGLGALAGVLAGVILITRLIKGNKHRGGK